MVVNLSHIIPHLACLAVSPAPLDSGTPKSKEPRLKHRCSGPLGAFSRLIGGRHRRRGGNNNKQQQKLGGEEDGDGHIFYPQLPLSADPGGSTGAQIGMREGVKEGNLFSHKLTAHVGVLSVAFC